MKRCLLTILSVFLSISLSAAQSPQKIKATGEGPSKQAAIDQAKRSAVEQGVGSIVSSETLTLNFQLASDKIFSRASGFVKNYREISSVKTIFGFQVEIEAEVTEIFDELLKDQTALDLLLEWMEKPRFMIIVEENNLGQATDASETELARKLAEKHFDLISRQQVDAIRRNRLAMAAVEGSAAEAAALAADLGAEMILAGKAVTTLSGGIPALEGSGMKSVQADFTARIVDANSGRIMASFTTHAPGIHISTTTAGIKALTKAAAMMADSLTAMLLKRGSQAQITARMISVTINGVGFRELKIIKDGLSGIPGVSAVYQRSFRLALAELGVEYSGAANDLAMELDGFNVGGHSLQVVEVAGNTISLRVSE